MRKPWSDGTTEFLLRALEWTERLAAYVVPRRVHTVHDHGLFAPRSSWRADVVPSPAEVRAHHEALEQARAESALQKRIPHVRAAELLERVFSAGATRCPKCGEPMQLRAVVIGRPAMTRVLAGLRRSAPSPGPVPVKPRAGGRLARGRVPARQRAASAQVESGSR